MHGQKLVLIVDDDAVRDRAAAEADQVLEHWYGTAPPPMRTITVGDVLADETMLDQAGVVWLMCGDLPRSRVGELAALAEDRHLPLLLCAAAPETLRPALANQGVALCVDHAPPAVQCAMLASLWSQAPVLRELRADATLLRDREANLARQIGDMDEELRLAAKLQREFMPHQLPQVGDVTIEALWRPASYVSGDMYDATRLDEQHVGFFIADAVGHGVSAALLTMYIKSSLRMKELTPDAEQGYRLITPGEALAALNEQMLSQQAGHVRFATACCGLLNCRTHELTLARAGHPFPMLLHRDGGQSQLEPDGGLLGVFPEAVFEETRIQLTPGDRLLLYSDGFEMAFPDATTAPDERRVASTRYLEEFDALRHDTLAEALAHLQQRLDQQAGSLNQRDDLTVLGVSISGETATATAACALATAHR